MEDEAPLTIESPKKSNDKAETTKATTNIIDSIDSVILFARLWQVVGPRTIASSSAIPSTCPQGLSALAGRTN